MSLADRLLDDVKRALGDFGEDVTYYDDGVLSAGRVIKAIIDRLEPELDEFAAGRGRRAEIEIQVTNEQASGVDKPTQSDLLDLPWEWEGNTRRFRVAEVLSADQGAWKLRCVGLGTP